MQPITFCVVAGVCRGADALCGWALAGRPGRVHGARSDVPDRHAQPAVRGPGFADEHV